MAEIIRDIPYYDADMRIDNDVAYARERCRLDLYTPERKGASAPVVVHIHGGGMTCGEKELPRMLTDSGLVVIGVNYRLSGERAKCPDYLYDAAAATAWAFRHAAEYGGNPEMITVTGGSAGGYLAAMVGLDPRWLERFGIDCRKLFLIAPVSGQMTTHFQILNERLGTNQAIPEHAVIDDFAPIYHASADRSPVALYTGGLDLDWPSRPQENLLLAATLRRIKLHADTTCENLPGFEHGDVYDAAHLLLKKRIDALAIAHLRKNFKARPFQFGETLRFQARRGGETSPSGTCVFRKENGSLRVEIECMEPLMATLVSGTFPWEGDSVELYLSRKGKTGQWAVGADGSFSFVPLGLEKTACVLESKRGKDRWSCVFSIPESDFGGWDGLTANAVRRRCADGGSVYTNLSPIFGAANNEPESFMILE